MTGTSEGSTAELVEDGVVATAVALVAWAVVLMAAEAAGLRPWRWPGGTVGGVIVALAAVGVPAFVARRGYDVAVPERWVVRGLAFLVGAVLAAVALLGVVLASLFSGSVLLPPRVLSRPVAPVAAATGGLLAVGVYEAAERAW